METNRSSSVTSSYVAILAVGRTRSKKKVVRILSKQDTYYKNRVSPYWYSNTAQSPLGRSHPAAESVAEVRHRGEGLDIVTRTNQSAKPSAATSGCRGQMTGERDEGTARAFEQTKKQREIPQNHFQLTFFYYY